MMTKLFVFLIVGVLCSLNAIASPFGEWEGVSQREVNGNVDCSFDTTVLPRYVSTTSTEITIQVNETQLVIDRQGGCTTDPQSLVFSLNGSDISLNGVSVGKITSDSVSILRTPGSFGGTTLIIEAQAQGDSIAYSEEVSGGTLSTTNYRLSGNLKRVK